MAGCSNCLSLPLRIVYFNMAPTKVDKADDANSVRVGATYAGSKGKANEELEFGGLFGVVFLILWSHYILFYFW